MKSLSDGLLKWILFSGAVIFSIFFSMIAQAAPDASFAVKGVAAKVIGGPGWAFWIFGGLTVIGAVATITRRNPVVAAICLVGTLGCSAVIYLLLNATFIAAMQVLVYAGAIMVLFIFVVMAVEHPEAETFGLKSGIGTKIVGIIAMALLFVRLVTVLWGPEIRMAQPVPEEFGTVNYIGRLLFSNYLFPFEAISILLLVAIVGAVVVSRQGQSRNQQQTEGRL